MSKLLKAVVKRHRPAIAAKMTPENGYDETKHLTTAHLKKAGIISAAEQSDVDGCVDDLANDGSASGAYLNAVSNGRGDATKMNDEDFVNSLLKADGIGLDDGDDTDDSDDGDVESLDDDADLADGITDRRRNQKTDA